MTSIRRSYTAVCFAVIGAVFCAWPVFAAMEVNIKSVARTFLDNPIRAEQIYMNKEVQTEGEIAEIRRGDSGGFVVILKDIGAGGLDNYYFHCWLADESVNRASSLSRGHKIGIRGTVYDFHQRERGIFIEGNIVSLGGSVITHVLTQAQIKFRQELDNARSGNVNAQINVGWRYENGDGTEKNFSEATHWYAEAAKKGNAMAMNNLAILYERGTGVKQNYSEARKLYRQAADKGNQYGMWNLGLMSENGIGTEKNLNEAIEWYYKAAEKKHDSARNRLKALAEGGNAYAQNMLGHFYYLLLQCYKQEL